MNAINEITKYVGIKHRKKKYNGNCLLRCLCRQQTSGVIIRFEPRGKT